MTPRAAATRIACAVLVVLGVAAVVAALRLSFGSARQPETGFFPTLVALALLLFSGLAFAEQPKPGDPDEAAEAGGMARIGIVVGATAGYAALIQPVGFLVCTAGLLLLLLRGIGQLSWTASVTAALAASVASYELFTRLGMPLPAGILPI